MQLSVQQTQELLRIIDSNQSVVIASELGSEFLTDYDIYVLKRHGIDPDTLYKPEGSSIVTSFHFGMLAEAIGQLDARNITYQILKEYVAGGNYIPVSARQLAVLDSIKMQTFSSLKTLNGNIFSDINNIITNNTRATQQEFLAEKLKEGITKRQSVAQIAHEIAHKTGDWSRNFDRIIETASQNAFEQGKAAEIQRQNPDKDPLCWKRVFTQACKHCIKAYLTNGIGSEPKLFKLSDLAANGSNIGKKVDDWLPTVEAMHPHCRCSLQQYQPGYLWNTETQAFDIRKKDFYEEVKQKRKLVRVVINGREVYV